MQRSQSGAHHAVATTAVLVVAAAAAAWWAAVAHSVVQSMYRGTSRMKYVRASHVH